MTTSKQDALRNGHYPMYVAMVSQDPKSVQFSPKSFMQKFEMNRNLLNKWNQIG